MSSSALQIHCAACGAPGRAQRVWADLAFHRCRVCKTLFVDPQPSAEQLERAYRSHYYPEVGVSATYENTPRAVAAQLVACLVRLGVVGPGRRRVLDFGSGVGDFAAAAVQAGLAVHAVESDPVARAAAQKRGIATHADLKSFRGEEESRGFDLVSLLDVLEHVRDPLALLTRLRGVLRDEGALYLSAPNYRAPKARLLGSRWDQATNATHLFLFCPDAISYLLEAAGFRMTWLPCVLRDPAVGRFRGALSAGLQRVRLNATLRVVARAV